MDWKGLVQFALMGNANLEQYAILLVPVSIGLFLAISGANKLFFGGGTKAEQQSIVNCRGPRSRCLVREVFLVADALFGYRRVFCWKILVD